MNHIVTALALSTFVCLGMFYLARRLAGSGKSRANFLGSCLLSVGFGGYAAAPYIQSDGPFEYLVGGATILIVVGALLIIVSSKTAQY